MYVLILATDQISRRFWVVGTDSLLRMWLETWTSWWNKVYGLQLGQLAQLEAFHQRRVVMNTRPCALYFVVVKLVRSWMMSNGQNLSYKRQ